jgi:hypothetical protein
MLKCKNNNIFSIGLIMAKYKYLTNETINRRISNYEFNNDTIITYDEEKIKISTEINIKGIYNVLFIYRNGESKLEFEIR